MAVTFERVVESILCANGGSDINFLPQNLWEELTRSKKDMKVIRFESHKSFSLANAGKRF